MWVSAPNIISRQGGVIAEDGTGRGVDISDVNAAADKRSPVATYST